MDNGSTSSAVYVGLGSLATAILVGIGALVKDWWAGKRQSKQDVVTGLWQLIDRLERDRDQRQSAADECQERLNLLTAQQAADRERIAYLENVLSANGLKFPARTGGSGVHQPIPPASGGGP